MNPEVPAGVLALGFGCLFLRLARMPRELRQERARPSGDDQTGLWGSRLLFVCLLSWVGWSPSYSPSLNIDLQVTGLCLALVGLGLIERALAHNPWFTPLIRVQSERDHRVVSKGPYAHLRHPGYLGELLLVAGIPLSFGVVSALAIWPLWALLIWRRIRLEERVLLDGLEGYAAYRQRVPGLWPRLRTR